MYDGSTYSGVCVNCVTQKEAEKFEAEFRSTVESVRAQKSVKALVENFRREMTGAQPLKVSEAYKKAAGKPSARRPSEASGRQRENYWNDFASWLSETHPLIEDVSSITRSHCESYVRYLMDNGRFNKEVTYTIKRKKRVKEASYVREYQLSNKTIKEIAGACKGVISKVMEDAGLSINPWEGVILPRKETTPRDIFTEDELRVIAEALPSDPFCRPLFTVAAATGLTEGDICMLEWKDIDPAYRTITRRRRKTGSHLSIPIIPPLREFLLELERTGGYVFPEQAEMYSTNASGVSYRVKRFLDSLGIETTKDAGEGRRRISVKDLHSMRHVFCYYAGQAGIPVAVVQSLVGHMTPEMTRHYMSHADDAAKREAVRRLPAFLAMGATVEEGSEERKRLAEMAWSLPLDKVREILGSL